MPKLEFYQSRTGLRVCRRRFETCGPVRAGAVFVHGLGDHGGRHDRHLTMFAEHGVQCVAIDLPGHGLTEGLRGHVTSLQLVMDLIHENVDAFRERYGHEFQVGVCGHSMGGFLSLCYLTRNPTAADFSWVSSPLIDPASKATLPKRLLVRLVDRLRPEFAIESKVASYLCKRDAASVAATRADKLVHRRMTVRLGSILVDAARILHREAAAAHPDLLLLMTHGSDDAICCPHASRWYFNQLPCRTKRYVSFDGLLHEPFNDIGKEHFYEQLEAWIASNLQPTLGKMSLHAKGFRHAA